MSIHKFRVYDLDQKRYSSEFIAINQNGLLINVDNPLHIIPHPTLDPNRYILETYSGRRDKKGVEIYENDIIRLWIREKERWQYRIVRLSPYNDFSCSPKLYNLYDKIQYNYNLMYAFDREDMEVDGNIHNNMDLFK